MEKVEKRDGNQARTIRSKPASTIFDHIDYIDIVKLVQTCINRGASNLKYKYTNEDLIQESMLKLAINTYDPDKSAPSTFIYMCCNSLFGNLYNRSYVTYDRHKETNDHVIGLNDDGGEYRLTDTAEDHTTPEDIMIANEIVAAQPLNYANYPVAPLEYNARVRARRLREEKRELKANMSLDEKLASIKKEVKK